MEISTIKTITLPVWIKDEVKKDGLLKTNEERTEFVLNLAKLNVQNKTGGPFAAAIFNSSTHELISVGVNLVVEQNCSPAHAEVVAIIMAQEKVKNFRLNDGKYVLVSSAQPCAMCAGAIVWSGVQSLVYGAAKEDVESIVGFDEGPVHPDWIGEYKKRGIEVIEKVCHEKSRQVLQFYKDSEGLVY